MLNIQHISYTHPSGDVLFDGINLSLESQHKIALIGNNGSGKSTLLRIIAGKLSASYGTVQVESSVYFVPQVFGQYNDLTVAEALGVADKLKALHAILKGDPAEKHYEELDDDWMIEERCHQALQTWEIENIDLHQKMGTLSGGQKTKVFLSGIAIHRPDMILLDEPSNHLDASGRSLLYNFVVNSTSTLLVVSHDRILLNLLDSIYELTKHKIAVYGGNYDFYCEQKKIEAEALTHDIRNKERALKKAKDLERATADRQQKLDAKAKKNAGKAGLPKIVVNTLRNSAENSSAKIKSVHAEKTGAISQDLQALRSSVADRDQMLFNFDDSHLHKGKKLFTAVSINLAYDNQQLLWAENRSVEIRSGERIALKGKNGSGKTTLINIILKKLVPQVGSVTNTVSRAIYMDQDYSMIDNGYSVYEQAQQYNSTNLLEHEVKVRLNRFLFAQRDWDKPCGALSGGERMRLMICCLNISNQSPDIIILDEPTNNLDIQNVDILTQAINSYRGTLLVVSHDELFLEQIQVEHLIELQ